MISLVRDLAYLARETVGAIAEGIALGLKIYRDESAGVDEITHGAAWRDESQWTFNDDGTITFHGPIYFPTSSVDGAVTDPAAEESPAAAASATDAAAGHPNGWAAPILDLHDQGLLKLEWVAAFGLSQWIAGEPCDAPTYFKSIVHDLDQLSK